ncbi:MAG: DUF1573 domain-containing protein [Puniceicoccaceae bacterium]
MRLALVITSLILGTFVAQAALEFEQTEIVNNPSLMDQKAEAVFRFTNTGEEAVTLINPTSSCGCTVPKLEKLVYQPGESGDIKAVFTFGSRVGKQTKRITVRTTSPSVETYVLTMTTHIPEWLKIEPRVLRWTMDEPVSTREISVTIPEGRMVEVSLPERATKMFDAELSEESAGSYRLKITPKNLATKATEFLRLSAKISDGNVSQTRSFGVHCLVR